MPSVMLSVSPLEAPVRGMLETILMVLASFGQREPQAVRNRAAKSADASPALKGLLHSKVDPPSSNVSPVVS